MKPKSRLVTTLALVALATLVTFGIFRGTQRTHAQDIAPPVPDRISFGMIGIARGQTARISVANIIAPSDSNIPPFMARVSLTFLNSDGEVLRTRDGQPVQRTMTLEAGHSAFLQISADEFIGRNEVRLNFRPVVIVQPPPSDGTQALPPSPIVPALEVIDNATAKTTLLYPGVIRGFNPQPDPPLAIPQ